jgi:hypothetical protein
MEEEWLSRLATRRTLERLETGWPGLLVNPGGVSRKRTDGTFTKPVDEVVASRLSLLLSNFVRPGLQAIRATQSLILSGSCASL